MGLLGFLKSAKREVAFLATAGGLARVAIPGEATVELPVGTIRFTFEILVPRAKVMSDGRTTRPTIDLSVDGPSGPLEVAVAGAWQADEIDGRLRIRYGDVVVPAAGPHRIVAAGLTGGEQGSDPALLVDIAP